MITTERCELHDLEESDVDHVVKLEANMAVRHFLGGPKDEQTIRLEFRHYGRSDRLSRNWTIRNKEDGSFIGLITLDAHHNGIDTEVSYQILPEWWGKGYATETVQAVIAYGLEVLKLPRIVAETQMANIRSRRLLERLGFCLQDRLVRFGEEQAIYSASLQPNPQ
jgi:ribosomal-protein-alanine N-acetyltransferase